MDSIMHVNPLAVRFKSRALLLFSLACLWACHKKQDVPAPVPDVNPAVDTASASGNGNPSADSDSVVVPSPAPPAVEGRLEFSSHPAAKAYLGRPYAYRPALSRPGSFTLRIAKGADSTMRAEKGQVIWTPLQAGKFPVILEATLSGSNPKDGSATVRQEFNITVEKVLNLVLKPFPTQVGKGDSVLFDLRGTTYPAWAAPMLSVRFDFEGDGKWDTDPIPLAANLARRHAYATVGRYAPKVEAHYKDLEKQKAEGTLAVISPVMPVLKMSPDTVEPGGAVSVDVSESRADGRLVFSLDLDGDGKPDWIDSTAGKTILKAPGSGIFHAMLSARNPMGQEGKAGAVLRVNARPRLDFKIHNPKENMAAPVEIKVRARDVDDSLAKVRVNYTGDAGGWETRTAPPDSVVSAREWWLRFKHVYGKTGKYAPSVCVTSADGREACQKGAVEIFNAPPVCQPGADLHATLGKPMEIDGSGVDPDGKIVKWEWDLDGDGKYDLISAANGKFQYTFSREGMFSLALRVTTADGATATGSRKVEVRKKWKT